MLVPVCGCMLTSKLTHQVDWICSLAKKMRVKPILDCTYTTPPVKFRCVLGSLNAGIGAAPRKAFCQLQLMKLTILANVCLDHLSLFHAHFCHFCKREHKGISLKKLCLAQNITSSFLKHCRPPHVYHTGLTFSAFMYQVLILVLRVYSLVVIEQLLSLL